MLNTFQADVGEIQTKELNKFRAIAEGQLGILHFASSWQPVKWQINRIHIIICSFLIVPRLMKIRQALAIAEQRAIGTNAGTCHQRSNVYSEGLEVKDLLIARINLSLTDICRNPGLQIGKKWRRKIVQLSSSKTIGALTPQDWMFWRVNFQGVEDGEVVSVLFLCWRVRKRRVGCYSWSFPDATGTSPNVSSWKCNSWSLYCKETIWCNWRVSTGCPGRIG